MQSGLQWAEVAERKKASAINSHGPRHCPGLETAGVGVRGRAKPESKQAYIINDEVIGTL